MDKYERTTFETNTGLQIRVRPILPQDASYLVEIFEHMSPESRYSRFRQPLANPNRERVWEEAESIARGDARRQVGFIAFADLPSQLDAAVGAVRFVCLGDSVAEAAVSVRDDLQRQGIGTQLLHLLAEEARAREVHKLVASVQNTNKGILKILRRMPYKCTRVPDGSEIWVELDLTQPRSDGAEIDLSPLTTG